MWYIVFEETNNIQQSSMPNTSSKSVIVVWAGMAWITAAKDLQEAGYDVTILEASPRIGGRLFTTQLSSGVQIDLWASRIHGIENNPIKDLIDNYTIKTSMTDYDDSVWYISGKQVSQQSLNDAKTIYNTFRDYIDEVADEKNDSSLDIYVYDYAQKLNAHERKIFLSMIQTEITNDTAADPKHVSTLSILKESEAMWDDAFVHGYVQLAENMATDLTIQTGSRVTKIDYTNTGVIVQYNSGDVMFANYVVVTVPLGVLKKWVIQFVPELPENKKKAIAWLDMGVLNKTVLQFDTVFREKDKERDSINYIDHPEWARTFWINAYKYTNIPILIGFNWWDYAKNLETKTDQEIIAEAMKSLRAIYGELVTQPTHYAISRWSLDENTYWAYSFVPVGATDKYYDTLAESIDNKIFFAGEATHKDHHSTVLWAYLSGKREAKKISDMWK